MKDDLQFLSNFRDLNILVAPLNWGLGHATRCIPIIDILDKQNNLIIASDGLSLEWLRKERPTLTYVCLPSYNIRYSNRPMWLNMCLQLPKIIRAIRAEKIMIYQLVSKLNLDLIISDHRLGVCSKEIKSILIAHQLTIPHPNQLISDLASSIQLKYIKQFSELWIPDYSPPTNLSGVLSKTKFKGIKRFIGPISRFQLNALVAKKDKYDLAIVLSGPEPARTKLEEILLDVLENLEDEDIIFVRGTNKIKKIFSSRNKRIKYLGLAGISELKKIFNQSAIILCRSGYSSIMDLQRLNKKAILIPTPNQPEQEYLARLNSKKRQFFTINQSDLDIKSLNKALDYFADTSK